MLRFPPISSTLSVAIVPTLAFAVPALAQVNLSGAASQSPPTADRGGRMIVGIDGTGLATISGGIVLELESALLPPDPLEDRATVIATSPFFLVGEQAGGIGSAVVEGVGTTVLLRGSANAATVHTGNRGGTGTLEIRDGATVRLLELAPEARTVPDLGTTIFVGASGGTGTLLVDDANAEVIGTFGAFMFVGDRGGAGSAVFRNGASLTLSEIASDHLGNGGNGASIVVGRDPADPADPAYTGGSGGTGSLLVDGSTVSVTSANATAQLIAGREAGTFGSIRLTGGSQVNLAGNQALVQIGRDGGSQGVLTMDGGAVLTLDGGTSGSPLRVGAAFSNFGRDEGGSGVLQMSGDGTRMEVIGGAIVGAPVSFGGGSGSGLVSVSQGATLQAGTVHLGASGALVGAGGIIDANVSLDGGVIAPGLSPGSLSIMGDLNAMSGIFEFEFAGSAPALFDSLNIFGDLTIGDDVTFRFSFLDGFIPAAGTTLNFLNVGGSVLGSMFNVVIEGISDGAGLSLFSQNGSFVLAQGTLPINDGEGPIAPIPLPASALLLFSGVTGLAALRRRRLSPV